MDKMTVKSLKEGMNFQGPLLITERKEGTTKTGNAYLDLTLGDKSGTVSCKLWAYLPAQQEEFTRPGMVIDVTLVTSTYNGALQGKIETLKPSPLDPKDFVIGTRFDIKEMFVDVWDVVNSFNEPLTKFVAETLLKKFDSQVVLAPAATGQHNNWVGGLLEHVWSMTMIAKHIVAHYQNLYQSKISSDKVLFGLIMHDLGKVVEYEVDGVSAKYSPLGVLTPHIVVGIGWIYQTSMLWRQKNPEVMSNEEFQRERDHLVHLVASHHGKLEWGSPVVPSTLEAILVHQIDMVDSKFMHALSLTEGKQGQLKGFSERSRTEGTSFLMYNQE